MLPDFHRQAVHLASGTPDRDGVLVFGNGDLLAVLVQLTTETHKGLGGLWFLEAGFGYCQGRSAPLFQSPEEAERWIGDQMRLAGDRRSADASPQARIS
jgi:hypothetical protein